jgi:hypothetical protein
MFFKKRKAKKEKRESLYKMVCQKIPNRATYWNAKIKEVKTPAMADHILKHIRRLQRLQLSAQYELQKL